MYCNTSPNCLIRSVWRFWKRHFKQNFSKKFNSGVFYANCKDWCLFHCLETSIYYHTGKKKHWALRVGLSNDCREKWRMCNDAKNEHQISSIGSGNDCWLFRNVENVGEKKARQVNLGTAWHWHKDWQNVESFRENISLWFVLLPLINTMSFWPFIDWCASFLSDHCLAIWFSDWLTNSKNQIVLKNLRIVA